MKKISIFILVLPALLMLTITAKAQKKIKPKSCADIVSDILTSSPRFQKLTKNLFSSVKKNKGTGYGTMLDSSPNPTQDGANALSDKYELSLHESYPDRMVNIAHFQFDPKTKQLYEIDMADPDKPKSIPFNKKLLSEFTKACK